MQNVHLPVDIVKSRSGDAQPDDADNKLKVRQKKHAAAAVSYLVEENPLMKTAFQQRKQVAVDVFKVKKQSIRKSWKGKTSNSRERQQKSSRKQPCRNCDDRKCTVKCATCGYQEPYSGTLSKQEVLNITLNSQKTSCKHFTTTHWGVCQNALHLSWIILTP